MNDSIEALSPESLQALLEVISPGSVLRTIDSLEGSFSNSTQLLVAQAADGSPLRLVIRRYAVFGNYDRGEKARREFKTLQVLYRQGAAVPEPIFLDEAGAWLGTPGIVTRFAPGALIMSPPYPNQWAETLAKTLAKIHMTQVEPDDTTFLLDANREALWFLHSSESIPNYVSVHPQGALLWEKILGRQLALKNAKPTLVHIDYWSGNVLWVGDSISAVVDWEEAAYGDSGIDVAYCRMDMILAGQTEAADIFLKTYETEMKGPVANLGLWELAAAVRPLVNPVGWISESPAKERFASFVESAIRKV